MANNDHDYLVAVGISSATSGVSSIISSGLNAWTAAENRKFMILL